MSRKRMPCSAGTFTWVVATCVLIAPGFVITPMAGAQSGRTDGARMEIEPEEYDFGVVRQNQQLVHEFVVKNVGTEELEIRKIATSCGCTAALVSDRRIAPGEQTILKVTLETRRYRGRGERTVSLASNDRRRVLQVRVQAFVEAPP